MSDQDQDRAGAKPLLDQVRFDTFGVSHFLARLAVVARATSRDSCHFDHTQSERRHQCDFAPARSDRALLVNNSANRPASTRRSKPETEA